MSAGPSLLDTVDIAVIGKEFDVFEKLGEGSYGVVFRAATKDTGAPVAIKKLRLDGFAEGVPATAIREITLLQELKHPFVVKLLRVLTGKRRVYLVFELLAEDLRMSIVKLAKDNKTLSISQIQRFTKQALVALWHMHYHRVVHRDLKPGNLLVSGDGRCVKIADFGLARSFEMELVTYTHEVVTLWYRAPEILLGERHYTPAVDVWSMGCILMEMLNGRPPFRGENDLSQLVKYFQSLGTPTDKTWPGVTLLPGFKANFPTFAPRPIDELVPGVDPLGCDLVSSMLTMDPEKRITVAEALVHPWLKAVVLE